MISISFFIIFLFIFFSCESKEKKTESQIIHREISNEIAINNNKLVLHSKNKNFTEKDTIDAVQFGVKADYNGKTGTDNRRALQLAIDFCGIHKKVLRLPKGKMLVNSYTINKGAFAHGSIIELKSDTNIVGINS